MSFFNVLGNYLVSNNYTSVLHVLDETLGYRHQLVLAECISSLHRSSVINTYTFQKIRIRMHLFVHQKRSNNDHI